MKAKRYQIFLDDKIIGTTELESADASMGVVFGKIHFVNRNIGYDFFRNYCLNLNVELTADYPEVKILSTRTIKSLIVRSEEGIEIIGTGNQISGMDGDGFEIAIEGVAYPFFYQEFPHHCLPK